jgi:hypothetical protein
VFALRRDVDGIDGLRRRQLLTSAAIEALAVVEDAVAWRVDEARKAAEAKR